MGARRASVTAVVAVLGGVLILTMVVAWAASIGPSDVLRGDGPRPPERSVEASTATASPTTAQETIDALNEALKHERGHSDFFTGVAIGLELLLVAGLLYALVRLARWGWSNLEARDRPEPPAEDVEFDVLAAREPLVRELAAGAEEQREALRSGSPRNAIVEAWNRFEVQAGAAGVRRRPWETSSEFTLRVLETVDADSHAVAQLAGLFREARFSDHELSEQHREAAAGALATIHAGLDARFRPTGRT